MLFRLSPLRTKMPGLQSICVFCGASTGSNPKHMLASRALGEEMVKRRIKLVYGGARPNSYRQYVVLRSLQPAWQTTPSYTEQCLMT